MDTRLAAACGMAVEALERVGVDARPILRATNDAELLIALNRAVGALGGREGWEPAGRALDEARRLVPRVSYAEVMNALLPAPAGG